MFQQTYGEGQLNNEPTGLFYKDGAPLCIGDKVKLNSGIETKIDAWEHEIHIELKIEGKCYHASHHAQNLEKAS